jgi:hypothetical protein
VIALRSPTRKQGGSQGFMEPDAQARGKSKVYGARRASKGSLGLCASGSSLCTRIMLRPAPASISKRHILLGQFGSGDETQFADLARSEHLKTPRRKPNVSNMLGHFLKTARSMDSNRFPAFILRSGQGSGQAFSLRPRGRKERSRADASGSRLRRTIGVTLHGEASPGPDCFCSQGNPS